MKCLVSKYESDGKRNHYIIELPNNKKVFMNDNVWFYIVYDIEELPQYGIVVRNSQRELLCYTISHTPQDITNECLAYLKGVLKGSVLLGCKEIEIGEEDDVCWMNLEELF